MTNRAWSRSHHAARLALLVFLFWICLVGIAIGADGSETERKGPLVSRETNPVHFVRLVIQRLIYGFASMIGLGDAAEEIADGALVPPGVDDYGLGIGGSDNKDYDDGDDDYRDEDDGGDSYDYLY